MSAPRTKEEEDRQLAAAIAASLDGNEDDDGFVIVDPPAAAAPTDSWVEPAADLIAAFERLVLAARPGASASSGDPLPPTAPPWPDCVVLDVLEKFCQFLLSSSR